MANIICRLRLQAHSGDKIVNETSPIFIWLLIKSLQLRDMCSNAYNFDVQSSVCLTRLTS